MARMKSSACSAMRISKTACRKKQDDRLQSGDGRFLYPWYNYTICNHEIFRRYSGVPWPLPSAEGERFRRSGGLPPQARLAADGQAGHCRRLAAEVPVFTGGVRRAHGEGQKGARAPYGSLAPSRLPQTLLCAATPFGRAAKRGNGGSVPCVGQILDAVRP